MDRQLFAELYRFESTKAAALIAYKPEEMSELLLALSMRYRKEIIPWVLASPESSTEERQKKKKKKRVDLTDGKSVEAYYYAMIDKVKERTEKVKQEST
jgi:hypothetical protein